MNNKKSLGIFWDIENCPIPDGKSGSSVAMVIREFIANCRPDCGYAYEFCCACDTKKMPIKISEGLNRNGVDILQVNAVSKNAADEKLKEKIDKFVEKSEAGSVVVVITGDINFASTIRSARRKEFFVILINGENCSQDLKNHANEVFDYLGLIQKAEDEKVKLVTLQRNGPEICKLKCSA